MKRARSRLSGRTSSSAVKRLEHLAGLGEPPRARAGEDELAVHMDVKDATTAFDKLDVAFGVFAVDLVRQTGGAGIIVSNDAVFDSRLHLCLTRCGLLV